MKKKEKSRRSLSIPEPGFFFVRKMLKMSCNVVTYRSSNLIFVIMIAGTVVQFVTQEEESARAAAALTHD